MTDFARFVETHVERIEPLDREAALAYWDASLSGRDEHFRRFSRLQKRIEEIYADSGAFAVVRKAYEEDGIEDPLLRRSAGVLYRRYLGNQVDPALLGRIVELSSEVEGAFGTFRTEENGQTLTMNDVHEVLRSSGDQERRRRVWEANKRVGRVVADRLLELVRLRNESARAAGFGDYHAMSLELAEQDGDALLALFDDLDTLTAGPFAAIKKEIDGHLASRFGVPAGELRPWHYEDPFFQEAVSVGDVDLDAFYRGTDPVVLARDFYAGLGMDVKRILQASDLYEREGKNPHAFCTDIDRRGDVRILANMKDNAYWMETILHELGHGVYDLGIDGELPWLLRTYPHLATTEAAAMFFGRLAQDPAWMRAALGLDDAETERIGLAVSRSLRAKQLVFARWCQVMFRFERELYRDPGRDLNALWWDLVERHQLVRRPEGRDEPDWATKIHIVSSPVYYHNYMLGEMIASLFASHVRRRFGVDGAGLHGRRDVGDWFNEVVFRPGNSYRWDRHVELATGEALTAAAFADQFVGEAP